MMPRGTLLWSDVVDGLRAQPGRLGLSFMAIGVGIIALTVLVAVLGGLERRSRRMLREFGANVFAVTSQSSSGQRPLQRGQLELLRDNLQHCAVSGVRTFDVPTYGIDRNVTVAMTDPALRNIRKWPLLEGRFLDERDRRQLARHGVISRAMASEWNLRPGQVLNLRDCPIEIIGVVDTGGGLLHDEHTDAGTALGEYVVFVPYGLPAYWKQWPDMQPDALDTIYVQVDNPAAYAANLQMAQQLFKPFGVESRVAWVTPNLLLARIRKLQRTLHLTVGSIAFLCMVLGGTTLMSLMVANVRDRVTEIGLRRALGASSWDIASLFLMEACLVTGLAGLGGTMGTCLLLALFRSRFPVPLALDMHTVLLPVAAAVFLGAVFSYGPARAAARIVPAEALRND